MKYNRQYTELNLKVACKVWASVLHIKIRKNIHINLSWENLICELWLKEYICNNCPKYPCDSMHVSTHLFTNTTKTSSYVICRSY
jgi:hypothetical protein